MSHAIVVDSPSFHVSPSPGLPTSRTLVGRRTRSRPVSCIHGLGTIRRHANVSITWQVDLRTETRVWSIHRYSSDRFISNSSARSRVCSLSEMGGFGLVEARIAIQIMAIFALLLKIIYVQMPLAERLRMLPIFVKLLGSFKIGCVLRTPTSASALVTIGNVVTQSDQHTRRVAAFTFI